MSEYDPRFLSYYLSNEYFKDHYPRMWFLGNVVDLGYKDCKCDGLLQKVMQYHQTLVKFTEQATLISEIGGWWHGGELYLLEMPVDFIPVEFQNHYAEVAPLVFSKKKVDRDIVAKELLPVNNDFILPQVCSPEFTKLIRQIEMWYNTQIKLATVKKEIRAYVANKLNFVASTSMYKL